jgi:hypothetical protein
MFDFTDANKNHKKLRTRLNHFIKGAFRDNANKYHNKYVEIKDTILADNNNSLEFTRRIGAINKGWGGYQDTREGWTELQGDRWLGQLLPNGPRKQK